MNDLIVANVLDSMSDSLIALSKDGEVLYANRATETVLGYTEKEIRETGLGLLFFTTPENHAFNQIFIDTIGQKRINAYREVDYLHPSGVKKRLSATSSYMKSRAGDEEVFVGFVALFKDITEISRLRENEKRLLTLKQKLEKDRVESLRKVAMGVAHELRNPLVTIGGFARRIAMSEASIPENRDHAGRIIEDVQKLESLVSRIMEYCNLPVPRCNWSDFSVFVEQTVDSVRRDNSGKDILIRFENRLKSNPRIFYDESLARVALLNVLNNAVSFSEPNGEILVTLENLDDYLKLSVRDYGPGLKAEDLPYALDPLYSTRSSGQGMGLAIARRVIADHHGRMEIRSDAGKGASVNIFLPMRPPHRSDYQPKSS